MFYQIPYSKFKVLLSISMAITTSVILNFIDIKKQGYIKDRDGNKYDTIHYKGYAIMIENLQTKTFANGDKIERIKNNKEWKENNKKQEPGWCYYNNSKSYKKKYGIMYTAATVNDLRDLAPEGWHIPTSKEWKTIIGGYTNKRPNSSLNCQLKTSFIKDIVKKKKGKASKSELLSNKLNFTGYGFRDYKGNFKGKKVYEGKAAYLLLADNTYMEVGWLATHFKNYDYTDSFSGNLGGYIRCIKKLE